jgi:hypothetical protein
VGLGGGPGRIRTSNQTVMSTPPLAHPTSASTSIGSAALMTHGSVVGRTVGRAILLATPLQIAREPAARLHVKGTLASCQTITGAERSRVAPRLRPA